MLCPSCATENRDDATFCGECGAALSSERPCPTCARPNPAGQKFCDACAALLEVAAPPSRTPTPQPSPALPASFAGDRYQVKRFLGEGGRNRVYLAHDSKLEVAESFDDMNRPTAFAQVLSTSKARADLWPS